MTAAILATRLHKSSGTTLLLHLGTSARAVLHHDGSVTAAAADNCGAFDCVGIACGMRPETGAIEHVSREGSTLRMSVVGQSLPRGICGSGLLELAAALKQTGCINECGDFQPETTLNHPVYGFIETDRGPVFRLYADSGIYDTDIYVTQNDLYLLREAKARVADLIRRLLAQAGIAITEVERIIISGAFGQFSDTSALFELGILPAGMEAKVSYIGNAAKQGAQMVLLDKSILAEAEVLVQTVVCLPAASGPLRDDELHFLPVV
jgi:uncharacterized 2Fe-2S/4Fe-4S cluster protein (DUF4445 family)